MCLLPNAKLQGPLQVWLVPISAMHPIAVKMVKPQPSLRMKSILFHTNRGAFGTREVWQMDNGGHEHLLLKPMKTALSLALSGSEDRLAPRI